MGLEKDSHGRPTKPVGGKVSPIKKGDKASIGHKVGEKSNGLKKGKD